MIPLLVIAGAVVVMFGAGAWLYRINNPRPRRGAIRSHRSPWHTPVWFVQSQADPNVFYPTLSRVWPWTTDVEVAVLRSDEDLEVDRLAPGQRIRVDRVEDWLDTPSTLRLDIDGNRD